MKTTIKIQFGRFILLVGLMILSTQLFATETFSVKGQVQNSSNGNIKNAIVTLSHIKTLEPAATTKCNENGEFYFDKVAEGDYIMTVQKDGISRAKSKIISLDENGKIVEKKVERTETLQLIDVASY
jgi:hypothetical protein